MGYIRHHAILVTSGIENLEEAKSKADELELLTTEIVESAVNHYRSFAILPDGSKEGWGTSNDFDWARTKFIEWMEEQKYSDGSGPYDWVEVQYGDDELQTKIVRDSDHEKRQYK